MTEMRLPTELQQSLQQEAESLELPVAEFLQMLLNAYRLSPQKQLAADFSVLLAQAEDAHGHLLAVQELWA